MVHYLIGALALLLLSATPAVAQETAPCNDRATVLAHLAEKYTEAPVAMGVTNAGGLIEVLSAADGKTWTIIISTPQGMSCLIAAGKDWQPRIFEPTGPET